MNGATLRRTTALVELLGLDDDTGGPVWLVHTVDDFDPARGDWIEHADTNPDAVIAVAAACITERASARA